MSNDEIGVQISRIREKLQEAARARLRPFGWGRHGFALKPCADADDLTLFESLCHVMLPLGYRRFILEMGDGGAGPAYGLLPLAAGLARGPAAVMPDLLQKPFPYTAVVDAGELRDPETGVSAPRPGSITVCEEGASLCHFIVVAGPTRGSMWVDRTAADGGYEPLGVDFLTWYERWLDSTLAGGNGAWWRLARDGDDRP